MVVPALLVLNVSTMLEVTFVHVMPDTMANRHWRWTFGWFYDIDECADESDKCNVSDCVNTALLNAHVTLDTK